MKIFESTFLFNIYSHGRFMSKDLNSPVWYTNWSSRSIWHSLFRVCNKSLLWVPLKVVDIASFVADLSRRYQAHQSRQTCQRVEDPREEEHRQMRRQSETGTCRSSEDGDDGFTALVKYWSPLEWMLWSLVQDCHCWILVLSHIDRLQHKCLWNCICFITYLMNKESHEKNCGYDR